MCMPSVCDDNEIYVYSCVVLRETIAKTLVWTEIVFILKPVGRFSPLMLLNDLISSLCSIYCVRGEQCFLTFLASALN